MAKEITVTAATIEAAIEEALEQLGVSREDVEVEIIKEPAKRFFGESTDATLRVSLLSDETEDALPEEESEEDGSGQDDVSGSDEVSGYEEDVAKDSEEGFEREAENVESAEEPLAEQDKDFNKAPVQLSEEELDTIADASIEAIREFLEYFGLGEAEIDEYEGDEGELIFDIVGDNLAVLIGRHGKTLDSFQFLVSSIVGKKTGYRHPVIVDVEGYKHRRKQKLVSIAKSSATRAIRQKHTVNLRPMSPYERRIIHVALKEDKRIVTSSEGTEPGRYVVIRPV
jgi:spoIIIJ-associated protein